MTLLRGLTDLLNSVPSFLTALEVDIVVFVSVWDIFRGSIVYVLWCDILQLYGFNFAQFSYGKSL